MTQAYFNWFILCYISGLGGEIFISYLSFRLCVWRCDSNRNTGMLIVIVSFLLTL